MCITKTEAWAYAGVNYTSEKDAVKAALTDIGSRLIKEFHSNPLQGLLTLGAEVSELRDRYLTLLDLELHPEQAPPKEPEGTQGDPSGPAGGDLEDPTSVNAMLTRYLNLDKHHPVKIAVTDWLTNTRYSSIEAALQFSEGAERSSLTELLQPISAERLSQIMPPKNRRLAMRKQLDEMESTHPIKRAALTFMEREGYIGPRAFWTRANASQFDELGRILAIAK